MIKRPAAEAVVGKEHRYWQSIVLCERFSTAVLVLFLFSTLMLSGCGSSGSQTQTNGGGGGPLSGNWQFTNFQTDSSFQGGLNGGFLVQSKSAVTGQLAFSITLPSKPGTFCDSGSATVTGTVNGQNVALTAAAGAQTFNLTGALSADGSTMMGTYNSTGQGCGNPQSGMAWSATSVPPVSGTIHGSFHSTTGTLQDQDFSVTGTLTQGANSGTSSATITGTLAFQNYPCVANASVTGEISGNVATLQLFGTNGANIGTIGGTTSPVSFTSTNQGYVLKGTAQAAYTVSTAQCGDQGNICLALGPSNTACTQPISLSPAFLIFPLQAVGSPASNQSFTLTNTDPSGATVNGLTVAFKTAPSTFNLLPNFAEQDNCANPPGTTFSLGPKQSCTITISFAPQQSCPFQPSPSICPPFLSPSPGVPPFMTGQLLVATGGSPGSADGDNSFVIPVSGLGGSAIQASTPELDFGSEAAPVSDSQGEESSPQSVSLTNQSNSPVQILPAINNAHCGAPDTQVSFSLPLTDSSVPGLQVVNSVQAGTNSVSYFCDFDLLDGQPNFRLTGDTCSGTLLNPQQSCSLSVTYAPQEQFPSGLDYFLQLNTNQCAAGSPNCEIDSGRFPVELKANPASPLRISPAASLDFGVQLISSPDRYPPLSLTLFNDPNDPSSQTIHFTGKVLTGAAFSEIDTCGASLTPGSSCTFTVTFAPTSVGFIKGNITVTFNGTAPQIISLRGFGQ